MNLSDLEGSKSSLANIGICASVSLLNIPKGLADKFSGHLVPLSTSNLHFSDPVSSSTEILRTSRPRTHSRRINPFVFRYRCLAAHCHPRRHLCSWKRPPLQSNNALSRRMVRSMKRSSLRCHASFKKLGRCCPTIPHGGFAG